MSTIKSSAEDLTINADGSNEIKFQINAVEKASINSSGLLTSTTIDATVLTGNLPALNASSLTSIPAANITGTLPAIDGSSLTGVGGGLTQSSTWYVTTSYAASATNETITNWAESNAANYERLGTSPTQSSGIFTLPATGWWMITLSIVATQSTGGADSWAIVIQTSTDSGSTFAHAVSSCDRFTNDATNNYKQRTATGIVKCENVSTFRFQPYIRAVDTASFNIRGDTQDNGNGGTYMNIMKLADV